VVGAGVERVLRLEPTTANEYVSRGTRSRYCVTIRFITPNQSNLVRKFSTGETDSIDPYLSDALIRHLVEFFESKGLTTIKEEDRTEKWYEDWLAYQANHHLYAKLLSPKELSTVGGELNLLRLTRFLEVFGYFSAAHGYSLQVTFLGFFSILMGENEALKREAVAALEAGGLLAFGVSEQEHGSDLLANDFVLREASGGSLIANGRKYYIGNANVASMIAVLAQSRKEPAAGGRSRRALPVLFALRQEHVHSVRKIQTIGVRSAYVGEFDVVDAPVMPADVIADGRGAWDAVLGTVTLGKFFLGFGAIGMCERAFAEAVAHLSQRVLYGKPVTEMPHIRLAMAEAYARLTAMKLYAYRALDFLQAATADDRRYVLYNAVQKARTSRQGVRVMALLTDCMGAKAFEADGYFEMALRDVPLIPGLEGSAHINLAMTAEFTKQYFAGEGKELIDPPSVTLAEAPPGENRYLMEAKFGGTGSVKFPPLARSFKPLLSIPNVRRFCRQIAAFRAFLRATNLPESRTGDKEASILLGECMATVVYGQLVAEHAARIGLPTAVVSGIFHTLIIDASETALSLASATWLDARGRRMARRIIDVPRTSAQEWEEIAKQMLT
jgi:acyl-CoA dehydrogenase